MPSFDLATGYVTFKGNFEKFEADIAKAKVQAKELDEALNTEVGHQKFTRALYAAKGINAEIEKSNRLAKRLQDQVNLGKWGVFARDFKAGADKFATTATKFGAGATAVGAGALALGGGSSPLAQSTLEGSFKLLTTTIGGTFTPLVLDVSKALQDAAAKFREMSRETKDFVNEGAKFVGAAGLVALGLVAVKKGFDMIYNHPLVTMFTAGITIGGFVNNKWSASTASSLDVMQSRNQSLTMKDVQNDFRSRQMAKLAPDALKRETTNDFKKAWTEYEAKRQDYEEYRTGFMGGNIKGGMTRLADTLFFGAIEKKKMQDASSAQDTFERAKLRYAAANGVNLPTRQGAKGSQMLWGDAGPISSMSVTDLFKSFQTAGLKGGLAGEQAKTEQEQMLDLMKGWDAKIKGVDTINKPVMVP